MGSDDVMWFYEVVGAMWTTITAYLAGKGYLWGAERAFQLGQAV